MKLLGEIIRYFFKFLDHPSALGFLALISTLILVVYVLPLCLMTFISWDNTNRLETAQREGTAQTVNAIDRLGNHLNLQKASRK
jgi:hypothetical protein